MSRAFLKEGIIGLLAAVSLLTAGCGHGNDFVPLNGAALQASTPRTIRAPTIAPAKFDGQAIKGGLGLLLAGAAMGGVVGGAVAGAGGAAMAADDNVPGKAINDPAKFMRLELGSLLVEKFGVDFVLATAPADLQLEIWTVEWGIVATRLGHYGVNYKAQLRLWDLRSKKVVAQALCDSGPPRDQPSNPALDELETQAALGIIKGRLGAAAQSCLQEFRIHTLQLRP
jgi:hypothetical protein